jgi:hypothetical protein
MALLAYHPHNFSGGQAKPNEFGLDLADAHCLEFIVSLAPAIKLVEGMLAARHEDVDEGLAHLNRKRITWPQRRVVGWLFVQCRAAVGSPDVSERTKSRPVHAWIAKASGCRVIASLRLWIVKPPRLYVVPGFSEGLALTLHWRLVGDTSFFSEIRTTEAETNAQRARKTQVRTPQYSRRRPSLRTRPIAAGHQDSSPLTLHALLVDVGIELEFSTAEFPQLLPTRHELTDILAKNQEG